MNVGSLLQFNRSQAHNNKQSKHLQEFNKLESLNQTSNCSQLLCDALTHNITCVADHLERRIASLQSFLNLDHMRQTGQLCDAEIQVDDGTVFNVHRVILIAASSYFRALFTNGMCDPCSNRIFIREIDAEIMSAIIEWAYTRKVTISSENIERLLPAADRLQMLLLFEKCTEFLKKSINCENVVGVWRFAVCYSAVQLELSAFQYLMENFIRVISSGKEIWLVNLHELCQILKCDDLNMKIEEEIVEFAFKWIEFDITDRLKYVARLLQCLRLGCVTKSYLLNKIKTNYYLYQTSESKDLLRKRLDMNVSINNEFRFLAYNDLWMRPRVPHELLFVVGGWSSGMPTNSIEAYDCRANVWMQLKNVDRAPRAYHGCVAIGKNLYIIGGFDGTQYFNNCKKLNILTKEWKEISPMHWKRCYVSIAYIDDIIYALGGFDGVGRLNTAEKYNPYTNQWSLIADMNERRSDSSATSLDGKVYVCGGFDGNECLNSAEYYDPETDHWTLIRPMLLGRSGVGLINFNQQLYSIGGYDGERRLTSVEKYDSRRDEWTFVNEMKSPRSNFGVEILDGKILVLGGFNGYTTIDVVESYSEKTNEWTIKPCMNINRSALTACVVKGIKFCRPYSALNYYSDFY